MQEYQAIVAKGTKYEISIKGYKCGKDYSLTICGGEKFHIGAVALGCVYSYQKSEGHNSASVSVISVQNHKDDFIAREIADVFAREFACMVTVTAGIHVDKASPKEVQILLENSRKAYNELKEIIKKDT